MSIQAVSHVLEYSEATGNARCVLISIANRFDPKDPLRCYPGAEVIAHEARVSLRTAQRMLYELVIAEELVYVLNAGGDPRRRGDRRPNVYLLPEMIGVADLAELLATYDPRAVRAAGRWVICLPSTGCQVDTPCGTNGMSPGAPRGDNRRADGVSPGAPRGVRSRADGVSLLSPDSAKEIHQDPSLLERPTASASPAASGGGQRVEVFDALVEACGYEPGKLTTSARGALNRVVAELLSVGATPDEIHARADIYRRRWSVTLTPSALAKHWPDLAAVHQPSPDDFAAGVNDAQVILELRHKRALDAYLELPVHIRDLDLQPELIARALEVLDQNPAVPTADLVLALELHVEELTTAGGDR